MKTSLPTKNPRGSRIFTAAFSTGMEGTQDSVSNVTTDNKWDRTMAFVVEGPCSVSLCNSPSEHMMSYPVLGRERCRKTPELRQRPAHWLDRGQRSSLQQCTTSALNMPSVSTIMKLRVDKFPLQMLCKLRS